ncbi:MAG: signal peptide peptidase SppA [Bacteroidetes bacterium]|nr:signal peptide peptidase SppA [Bacteroidota bacterium]
MKQFFKFMFASMLGTFLMIVIVVLITFGIVAAFVAAASSEEVIISKNTLLHVKLNKSIVDRSSKTKFVMGYAGPDKLIGLNDILANLKKAKLDDKIDGIYLDLSEIPAGISTVNEIRDGLIDFKSSGKFIWAYSEVYSQKSYFLASVADKIFLNPQGIIEFKGLTYEGAFLKGLLAKLDIKMQVIRHGKFKAATEPLFLDKMSAENREQITKLINDVWDDMLIAISESRKISRQDLNRIADSLLLQTPEDALRLKFVDQLIYKDELIAEFKKKLKLESKDKIEYVSLESYTDVADTKKSVSGNAKIAIIYASGSIGGGEGDDESIGSERISKAIRKAREDDKIKAIVFRINSGGGSALASDVIWREIDLARKAKPVVASLGDVAASGGYYIACAATKIIADPSTITGSIGVFGVIPNMEGLFSNKLGITFDWAMTNKNGDYIQVMKPLSPYQTLLIQREVDHIYDVFTGKVADGRKLSREKVDNIGQGRIWSGVDAEKLGLIDEFGGLTKAVEIAAKLAKVKDYRTISLPEQKEWFQELIDQITGNDPSAKIREALGPDYRYYQYFKEIREMNGIQTRLLMDININ